MTQIEAEQRPAVTTPGLSHLGPLRALDHTGLSAWLLGFGSLLALTLLAFVVLILVRYPNPDMYRNSIAFCAIISFFLIYYFSSGRGWHQDMLKFLAFDSSLGDCFRQLEPSRLVVSVELLLALVCASINLQLNNLPLDYSPIFALTITSFYFLEYVMIVFCADILVRQLVCATRVARRIRLDLLAADFYSTLANVMVRHVGLYIFGMCIISLSYIVFTEGALGTAEMLLAMMPWYLPGFLVISLYLIPFNQFRKRLHSCKQQELNSIASALGGNQQALDQTLLADEPRPVSKITLLYYQDRIRAIREWPFTDKIRALVLFGILPPLTWVIAALIEIMIESSL